MGPASPRVDDSFLAEVIGAVPEGILSFDEHGTIVYATEQVESVLGRSPEDLLGHSLDRLLCGNRDTTAVLEEIDERLQAEPSRRDLASVELQFDHADAGAVSGTATVTEAQFDDRRLFVAVLHDASTDGRPRPEIPARLVRAAMAATDAVFTIDLTAGQFVDVNERACELLGYDRDTLHSLGPSEIHSHESEAVEAFLERVVETGRASTDEFSCQTADGTTVPVAYAMVELDTDEGPDVLASARPVTEPRADGHSLAALDEATRSLLTAESTQEVADTAVVAVRDALDCSLVAFWQTGDADSEDTLDRLAASCSTTQIDPDELPPIGAASVEKACFQEQTTQLFDPYDTVPDRAHPNTPLTSRLVLPVGTHGLLTVDQTDGASIDGDDRTVADIVTLSTAAALDRLDREQEICHRVTAMEATTDGTAIVDQDGEFVYVNDAYADIHGYERPEGLVGRSWRCLYDEDEQTRFEWELLPTVREQGHWRGEAVGTRDDGTTFPQDVSLTALDDGGMVCVVRDITDRKAYERQLQALNEVNQELTQAETADEVARTGLRTVEELFGFRVACVRFFDAEANTLEPVAMTDQADSMVSSCPAFDLESTLAGRAYRQGEVVHNEWETDDPFAEASAQAGLHLPLGDHGVLTIFSRDDGGFDDLETALAKALAASLRAALGRATREQRLRASKQELREQHERLETLYGITALVQEIGTRLIEATTRTELERTICTRLAASELYQSAWIGEVGVAADRVDVRMGAGLEDSYLNVLDELPLEMLGSGTVEEALETGEIQVIRKYETRNATGERDQEPAQSVEATAAIPLAYGERIHGVLVVNGAGDDVFSEDALAGFESLGQLTGFAITALKNREILLSDSIVELELTVADETVFASALTATIDCQCRFERSVPIEDGRVLQYDLIEGAEPGRVLDVAEETDALESATVILEQDDGIVFQTITERSLSQYALQVGASLQSATAEDGQINVTLEAPQSADVREIVDAFDAAFETVDVVAKRQREHAVQTAAEFRRDVAAQLTEKQRAALEAAYAAGYYEWPREVTAEELAESMGISSSTLHQHLRYGVQSLAEAFFEEPQRETETTAE
jgi:PAS domain S-box-containing protein